MGRWYDEYKASRNAAIDKIIAGEKDGPPGRKPGDEVSEALAFLKNTVKAYFDRINKECPTATVRWVKFYKKYRTNPEVTIVDTCISTEEEYLKEPVSSRVLSLAVEFAHGEDERLIAEEIPDGEGATWRFKLVVKIVEKKTSLSTKNTESIAKNVNPADCRDCDSLFF